MNRPTIKGVRIRKGIVISGLRALNEQLGPRRELTKESDVVAVTGFAQNNSDSTYIGNQYTEELVSSSGVPQSERDIAPIGKSFAEQLRAAEGELRGEWSHPKIL